MNGRPLEALLALWQNSSLSHTFDILERYIRLRPQRKKNSIYIGQFTSHSFDFRAVGHPVGTSKPLI